MLFRVESIMTTLIGCAVVSVEEPVLRMRRNGLVLMKLMILQVHAGHASVYDDGGWDSCEQQPP